MAYFSTKYEITAVHPDGRTYLVGYTGRKSRSGLLSLMEERGPAIVTALRLTEAELDAQAEVGMKPRPFVKIGGGWTIAFSGRTMIEARQAGAHPFVGAAVDVRV